MNLWNQQSLAKSAEFLMRHTAGEIDATCFRVGSHPRQGIWSEPYIRIHEHQQRMVSSSGQHVAAFCPEERGIFASLNVLENLLLPPRVRTGGFSVAQVYEIFPNLKERLTSQGTKLSGGEQQMLAVGRILRTGARLLLLDEPTEGLAPVIVQQIGRSIARLKHEGFTILLVEQNFRFAQTIADRHYVMENGRVVDMIPNAALEKSMAKIHDYLGV